MKQVVWTYSARRDLARIHEWYLEKAPDFADDVGDRAVEGARFLAQHPGAGSKHLSNDIRKWPVPGTDFRLFYRVTIRSIEIVRIRHARENWKDERG